MESADQQVARRHHTVPAFYLRGFAEGDRLTTVRLPGEHWFTQSVKDASVAKDFYAVEGHPDGEDVVEKALGELEGAAATVIRAVAEGTWPLAYEDRMTLGQFVALQATRVQAQRRTMDHLARQLLRLQIGAGGKPGLRAELERQGLEVTESMVEEMWQQATRREGPPITRPKIEHIQQMLELAEAVVPYVVGRPWLLVRFERRSLITSDSPVGLVRDPASPMGQGVGFGTALSISFPLTRKLGLLMTSPEPAMKLNVPVGDVHRGVADDQRTGTTELERTFNHYTVVNASEWLHHHPEDGKYVPDQLPDPTPVTISMSGTGFEFDGEPWFETPDDAEGNAT